MPGPPPSRNSRRRNVGPQWRHLPAGGRCGPPPDFPLSRRSKALDALWADLWSSPQAAAWEELGWTRLVARYAKLLLAAEKPGAPSALLGEVRQLEDRLGLSPMAMARLRWEVTGDAASGDQDASDVARLDEYRARLG